MASALKKRKSTYHHGNLREAILEESLKWIRKYGVESLSLREIAKKLGVTHSAPNKHFQKKEALVAALIEDGFVKFRDALLSGREQMVKHPKEAFIQMGFSYLKFAKENPEIYRLMFSNSLQNPNDYPSLHKAGFESFGVLLEAVVYMQSRGVIRKGNPHEIAYLIWSFTHGFVLLWQEGRIGDLENQGSKPSFQKSEEEMMRTLFHFMGDGIID
jgi:AcrR family transcriptional regulator